MTNSVLDGLNAECDDKPCSLSGTIKNKENQSIDFQLITTKEEKPRFFLLCQQFERAIGLALYRIYATCIKNSRRRALGGFSINCCGSPSSAILPLSIKINREATLAAKPTS